MFAPFFRLKSGLKRFGRAKRGTAAVEFALVAVPFFLLMIGTAEIALIGLAQSNLDYAVARTAREIRTGRAQEGGATAASIRQELCDDFARIMALDCEANLFLDVDRFDSFVDIENDNPVVDGELETGGFNYAPGQGSDIVVVRAYYRWHVVTPLFERVFANTAGGDRVLVATMMFRNEPF
jgi:Flp pilus assembly protein TadG